MIRGTSSQPLHIATYQVILAQSLYYSSVFLRNLLQYALNLRKPDLRKNLDLRKIVVTTDFLVHKLFDLRKIS